MSTYCRDNCPLPHRTCCTLDRRLQSVYRFGFQDSDKCQYWHNIWRCFPPCLVCRRSCSLGRRTVTNISNTRVYNAERSVSNCVLFRVPDSEMTASESCDKLTIFLYGNMNPRHSRSQLSQCSSTELTRNTVLDYLPLEHTYMFRFARPIVGFRIAHAALLTTVCMSFLERRPCT